jgi:hypothetical protein
MSATTNTSQCPICHQDLSVPNGQCSMHVQLGETVRFSGAFDACTECDRLQAELAKVRSKMQRFRGWRVIIEPIDPAWSTRRSNILTRESARDEAASYIECKTTVRAVRIVRVFAKERGK